MRLEGWTRRMDSRPSFETRASAALLWMSSEIFYTPAKRKGLIRNLAAGARHPQLHGSVRRGDLPRKPGSAGDGIGTYRRF